MADEKQNIDGLLEKLLNALALQINVIENQSAKTTTETIAMVTECLKNCEQILKLIEVLSNKRAFFAANVPIPPAKDKPGLRPTKPAF